MRERGERGERVEGGEVFGDGARGEESVTLELGALDDDVDGGSGDNGEVK